MAAVIFGEEAKPLIPRTPEPSLKDLGLEDLINKRDSILRTNKISSCCFALIGTIFFVLSIISNNADDGTSGLLYAIVGCFSFSVVINNYSRTIKKIKEIGVLIHLLEENNADRV